MNINNQKLNSFSKQNSENKMSLLFTDISVTFFLMKRASVSTAKLSVRIQWRHFTLRILFLKKYIRHLVICISYEQNPPNHVNTSLYYFHTSSLYKIYKVFFFSVQQFCYFFVIFVFYYFYYFWIDSPWKLSNSKMPSSGLMRKDCPKTIFQKTVNYI